MSHIRELVALTPTLTAANATTLLITAQDEKRLPATRKSTGYTGAVIVDQTHVIATELRKRGWVDVAITSPYGHGGYPHKMAQPAVLVLKKGGTVLESWAIVPGLVSRS
jgi:peroxiredoxin